MKTLLKNIYNDYFSYDEKISLLLDRLSFILQQDFSSQEIDFFKRCVDSNIDLEALELELRSIKKNNILSFIFLRLSSIAESFPSTQSQYINKKSLNIFLVFIFLSTTAINFIVLKVKAKLMYKNLIKEYPNV